MKTFGRYLSYRLRQSWIRTLIFAVLSISLSQSVIRNELESSFPESGLYILAIILGIFCTVIPMLELGEYKNRRNLDALYSFAISRKKLALLHYLSGWIQVTVIYTATYLFACLTLVTHDSPFQLIYLLPYYFLSLCVGLIMYSFFLFFFGEANSETDGVLFCVLGIFWFSAIVGLGEELLFGAVRFSRLWVWVYDPLDYLTSLFEYWIHSPETISWGAETALEEWYMFIPWGAIGIACSVGYFFTFSRKPAEKNGDISNSWFGYRTMIPIYGFFLASISLKWIFVTILMLAGYFIYRRSFKLKKSDLIVLGVAMLAAMIFGI
ncbi:MAG: hypothetical protein IKJ35_05835 [Clostridia bacterium]|nr:hypothetical protein [Clostridia bacterium]